MSVGLDFNSLRPKCWTAERSSGLLHKFFPFRLKLLSEAFLLGTETPGSHTGGTPKEAVTPNGIVHGQGTKTISRNRVLSCGRDHSPDLFSQHPAQISTLWWDGEGWGWGKWEEGGVLFSLQLPKSGTASLVAGIVSATTCENTVRDRRIVTPVKSN